MITRSSEWQPGDPLHPRGRYMPSGLYGFRDDSARRDCQCSDAAHWPDPGGRDLGDGDELGAFIEQHHAWRRSLLTMEAV